MLAMQILSCVVGVLIVAVLSVVSFKRSCRETRRKQRQSLRDMYDGHNRTIDEMYRKEGKEPPPYKPYPSEAMEN